MADILYPDGYNRADGTVRSVTWAQLEAKHKPNCHPEAWRRVAAFLQSRAGAWGIGEGLRPTQPYDPANPGRFAADGRSFHQLQSWRSGIVAYAGWDLVVRQGQGVRAPTWAEAVALERYGLHSFIGEATATKADDEPWHAQPIEIRGWQAWVAAGRKDPDAGFQLPGGEPLPAPAPGKFYPFSLNDFGLYPIDLDKPKLWPPNWQASKPANPPDKVAYLQAVLALKYGLKLAVDGQFGPRTAAAVQLFQADYGLMVDQIVGPLTWAVIDMLALRKD